MRPEVEYDPRVFEDRYSDDKRVWVRFFLNSVEDRIQSEAQGRPIFVEKEYVEIRSPGNETNIICRPVMALDKQRFPRHYELFKKGQSESIIGTPLSEVPWIKRSQVDEFKYLKIITVEHLAEVTDEVCTRIPGLYDLKAKARAYLDKAAAPNMEALLKRIAELEARLEPPTEE